MVLDALERMHAHLTAAVVSNDVLFLQVSCNFFVTYLYQTFILFVDCLLTHGFTILQHTMPFNFI